MNEVTEIIIHHSASPRDSTLMEDIRGWHTDADRPNGALDDIAYHYVIEGDGMVQNGRRLPIQGAHSYPNSGKVGICITGDNTQEQEQWNATQIVSAHLIKLTP